MSTWISRLAALPLCLVLAACDGGQLPALALFGPAVPRNPDGSPARALTRVSLGGGDVVVAGPDGYCIDPKTLRARGGRGFAMLASCRILTGGKSGGSVPPAIMTVTVGPRDPGAGVPDAATLAEVAGDGAAIVSSATTDGLTLVQLAKGGDAALPGGDPQHWRAAFRQSGRLVALALYVPARGSLAGARGGALLRDLAARIRKDSAAARKEADGDG